MPSRIVLIGRVIRRNERSPRFFLNVTFPVFDHVVALLKEGAERTANVIASRISTIGAAVLLAFIATSPASHAQGGGAISLDALDAPYGQDFNTLVSTGTSSVLPAGRSEA